MLNFQERTLQLLKDIEWSGAPRASFWGAAPSCPACDGYAPAPAPPEHRHICGHKPDCELDLLLHWQARAQQALSEMQAIVAGRVEAGLQPSALLRKTLQSLERVLSHTPSQPELPKTDYESLVAELCQFVESTPYAGYSQPFQFDRYGNLSERVFVRHADGSEPDEELGHDEAFSRGLANIAKRHGVSAHLPHGYYMK